MAIIFRYAHVPRPDGSLRNAPYIPIFTRTSEGKLLKIVALIDSGADNAVIPKDLADMLGLKDEGEDCDTGGIGGNVKVRKSRFRFHITDGREKHNLDVPALILQNPLSDVPLILGRHGFFEEFQITFKQAEEKVVLKKVQPKKRF